MFSILKWLKGGGKKRRFAIKEVGRRFVVSTYRNGELRICDASFDSLRRLDRMSARGKAVCLRY